MNGTPTVHVQFRRRKRDVHHVCRSRSESDACPINQGAVSVSRERLDRVVLIVVSTFMRKIELSGTRHGQLCSFETHAKDWIEWYSSWIARLGKTIATLCQLRSAWVDLVWLTICSDSFGCVKLCKCDSSFICSFSSTDDYLYLLLVDGSGRVVLSSK